LKRHAVLVSHSSPSGRLGGRVHAYVAAVLVAAGALSAALLLVGELSVERPWLLAVLAGLVALENVLSVRLLYEGGAGVKAELPSGRSAVVAGVSGANFSIASSVREDQVMGCSLR
jgi:hypothetical protein